MGRGSRSRADNPSQDSGEARRTSAAEPDALVPAGDSSQQPAGSPRQASGKAASDRSGQDERQRGWFWHWNGVVTQYAPLIGLKGVGLLNSYTVWTDRREDSPHRGYAFPSQQSEANFYGEDRAELITINKILVALDLIEIRKEMVRKVDEQGRRWKVPQNFYRVKDRPNGIELTTADVLRVIELADRDKAVYRYIRKVFSAKFEPIDPDNVWHRILTEIAEQPTWQKLAGQAAKQEARASARTKAGHRSRARQQADDQTTDQATDQTTDQATGRAAKGECADRDTGPERDEATNHDVEMTSGHNNDWVSAPTEQSAREESRTETSVADANTASGGIDGQANTGFELADDTASNGSTGSERGYVADANNGHEGFVEPGNTMYYESSTTTTTTTSARQNGDGGASSATRDGVWLEGQDAYRPAAQAVQGLPADQQAVEAGIDGEARAALGSGATSESGEPPQRRLADAGGTGPVGDPSPLVVSLYEAANDRRATPLERILLSELEAAADAPARAAGLAGADWVAEALREAVGSGSTFVAPKRIREIINRWASTGSGPRRPELDGDRHLEGGAGIHAIRHAASDLLDLKLTLDEMLGIETRVELDGSRVVVRPIGAPLALDDERFADVHRAVCDTLGRSVELRLGRPVAGVQEDADEDSVDRRADVMRIPRRDARQGEQLWSALLDMLAAEGAGADLLRLRAVVPLGERADGAFLLGTPTRLAARLLEGRYRRPVERSLSALLSSEVNIAVLNPDQWAILE